MLDHIYNYRDYLKKLKKEDLTKVIKDYNKLSELYGVDAVKDTGNKKESLIDLIDNIKSDYIKFIIMSLDLSDYNALVKITGKKAKRDVVDENKELVRYLITKRVLWQEDNVVIPEDVLRIIRSVLKDKEVIKHIKIWDKNYKFIAGMIIAYGVIDKKYFDTVTGNLKGKEILTKKLDFYYKKDYKINSKMIVSNKLSSKKRIDKYFKDINYKEFSEKEFLSLGESTYHHNIKSYKKFIKVLKNNYVFKKTDILFVDENIVIPYLYNSLNEEEIANKNLNETVISLFEFKGDKLKQKIISSVTGIREEFPLWEYRGFSKLEEK